jgi:hypothetical protein
MEEHSVEARLTLLLVQSLVRDGRKSCETLRSKLKKALRQKVDKRGRGERRRRAQSSKGNRACEKTSNASVITLVLKRTPELRSRSSPKKVSIRTSVFEALKKLAHIDSS